MIVLNAEQGSPEWHLGRLGIPTASRFKDIYTSTGREASGADTYMHELLADWLIGAPQEAYANEWMARGTLLEPEARTYYEFATDCEVKQVGFVYLDDRRMVGGSPDGLIGSNGGFEVKCPKASTHVKYLLTGKCPSEYLPQVQGNLWICEREWWDFMSYHPDMKPLIIRVNRDDKYIAGLSSAIDSFVDTMLGKRERLIQQRKIA